MNQSNLINPKLSINALTFPAPDGPINAVTQPSNLIKVLKKSQTTQTTYNLLHQIETLQHIIRQRDGQVRQATHTNIQISLLLSTLYVN